MIGFERKMRRLARAGRRAWLFAACKAAPGYGVALFALVVVPTLLAMAAAWVACAVAVNWTERGLSTAALASGGMRCMGESALACGPAGEAWAYVASHDYLETWGFVAYAVALLWFSIRLCGPWLGRGLDWGAQASRRAEERARASWRAEAEAMEIERAIGDAGLGKSGESRRRL